MKIFVVTLLAVAAYAADTQSAKPADACVPPPGSSPPPLPAKILQGQGSVHFPITTKSAGGAKIFRPGRSADALLLGA